MSWLVLALLCSFFESLKDVLTKLALKQIDLYFVVWGISVTSACFLIGTLLYTGIPQVQAGFSKLLLIGVSGNILATILFMRALKTSEISLCMPFIAFSPVFLLLTAPLIVGEYPTALGFVGIVLIVAGAYALNISRFHESPLAPLRALLKQNGPRQMLAVSFLWSLLAPIDKLGIQHSSPLFWITMFHIGMSLAFFPIVLVRNRKTLGHNLQRYAKQLSLIGLVFAAAHICQMTALSLTLVAYVIAIKRLSVIWGVLFGHFVFHERDIRSRLFGATVMVAGVIFIALSKD